MQRQTQVMKTTMREIGKDLDRWITEKEIEEAGDLMNKLPEKNKKFIEKKLNKLKREMELFGPQAVVSKYREYAENNKEDYLWWLDLPYVLCIELYTVDNEEQRIGFYSLEMAADLELEPKPYHVIAFEDINDCKNLGYIIQAQMDTFGNGHAFAVAQPPKALGEVYCQFGNAQRRVAGARREKDQLRKKQEELTPKLQEAERAMKEAADLNRKLETERWKTQEALAARDQMKAELEAKEKDRLKHWKELCRVKTAREADLEGARKTAVAEFKASEEFDQLKNEYAAECEQEFFRNLFLHNPGLTVKTPWLGQDITADMFEDESGEEEEEVPQPSALPGAEPVKPLIEPEQPVEVEQADEQQMEELV